MLPAYLAIHTAVSLIRKKCGEYVSLDALLQHAHEGNIALFALVREPIYSIERVENPQLSPSNTVPPVRGIQLISKPPRALISGVWPAGMNNVSRAQMEALHRLAAASKPPPLEAPTTIAMKNTSMVQCLAVADYVLLEPAWAGRIFASRENPRVTYVDWMSVKGEMRSIFKKQAVDSQYWADVGLSSLAKGTKGWNFEQRGWRVTEGDLFLKTSELDRVLTIFSSRENSRINANALKNEEMAAVINPIMKNKEGPLPLTKQQIAAKPWPIYQVNLEKILTDPPKWAEPACVLRNSPGNGSSLWNPALFAYCLATTSSTKRPMVKQEVLDHFMKKHFPDWVPQWDDLANLI